MNSLKVTLLTLIALLAIKTSGNTSDIVLPEFLTNPINGFTGLPVTNRFFTTAYNDNNPPATLGVTITNGADFNVNPWSGTINGGATPVSSQGGTYNPNGNYTYVGYTTTGTNTNRTRYYVNEQGWMLETYNSIVNIRTPTRLYGGDFIQQNARIAQVSASIEGFIAGVGHPYNTLSFLWNFDESTIDYEYNFNTITSTPFTPNSTFGSPSLMLQQALELNEGLDFIGGRWTPAQ